MKPRTEGVKRSSVECDDGSESLQGQSRLSRFVRSYLYPYRQDCGPMVQPLDMSV